MERGRAAESSREEVIKPRTPWTKGRRLEVLEQVYDAQGRVVRFERCAESQPNNTVKQFLLKRVRLTGSDDTWQKDLVTWSQLRHAHILQYCDAWVTRDVQHVLCENARMCLSVYLRDFAPEKVCRSLYPQWLFHIVSAVEYMHEHNNEDQPILHRSLQPDNIMVTEDKVLKLCAFGTSKRLETPQGKTKTRIGGGLFQSPEIAQGTPYDQSADIWSFGVTAVYIADYRRAGKAGSEEKLLRILEESGHSAVVHKMVERALQRDPSTRPKASAIVQSLQKHLSQEIRSVGESVPFDKLGSNSSEGPVNSNGPPDKLGSNSSEGPVNSSGPPSSPAGNSNPSGLSYSRSSYSRPVLPSRGLHPHNASSRKTSSATPTTQTFFTEEENRVENKVERQLRLQGQETLSESQRKELNPLSGHLSESQRKEINPQSGHRHPVVSVSTRRAQDMLCEDQGTDMADMTTQTSFRTWSHLPKDTQTAGTQTSQKRHVRTKVVIIKTHCHERRRDYSSSEANDVHNYKDNNDEGLARRQLVEEPHVNRASSRSVRTSCTSSGNSTASTTSPLATTQTTATSSLSGWSRSAQRLPPETPMGTSDKETSRKKSRNRRPQPVTEDNIVASDQSELPADDTLDDDERTMNPEVMQKLAERINRIMRKQPAENQRRRARSAQRTQRELVQQDRDSNPQPRYPDEHVPGRQLPARSAKHRRSSTGDKARFQRWGQGPQDEETDETSGLGDSFNSHDK